MVLKDNGRKSRKRKRNTYNPSQKKIADPETIYSYMEYFQKFSKDMFKEYLNITLDLGVAMNVYKLLWEHF